MTIDKLPAFAGPDLPEANLKVMELSKPFFNTNSDTVKLFNQFQSPTASFRGKPFWAWNGRLDEEELRRQIRSFKQMGFGGFFMHSRLGLDTPYLGDRWFDMIKACIDEAEKNDMEAWLYDEDRYPSGAAGGLVTADPKYRRRRLMLDQCPKTNFSWPETSDPFYCFAATLKNDQLQSYQKLESSDDLIGISNTAEILTFTLEQYPNLSWFNGYTFLDYLNPQAVAKFIEITHEAYRREVGEHFGKTVPGIFTDEPNAGAIFRDWFPDDQGDRAITWTAKLPDEFQQHYGYSILDHLPEIAYDLADNPISQARYHYHCCKTTLFVNAFAKLTGQWCEKYNMLSTGHVLEEEPLSHNVSTVGTSMRFYPHMQAPGIDVLTQFDQAYMTAKQCTSVARQQGKKWVLSELYAGIGWDITFETFKAVGDWQTALGVTLRCPHLSFYTMAGEAKRDYPPSIHDQCPWWQQYHYVEDYFSRLHVVLSAGQPICDIAVLHPQESFYLLHNRSWENSDRVKEMNSDYADLTRWLLGAHLDFDFLDETLLNEIPLEISRDDQGVYFQLGQMKYRTLLIPPLLTMRSSTLQWLKDFAAIDGRIVFAGPITEHIDAQPSEQVKQLAQNKQISFSQDAIVQTLQENNRTISIRDEQGLEIKDIFYQLRYHDNQWVLFLVNTNRKTGYHNCHIRIKNPLPNIKQLQLWDALTGEKQQWPVEFNSEHTHFKIDLTASGSALFVAVANPETLDHAPSPTSYDQLICLDPDAWEFSLDDLNVLVLDNADCEADIKGQEPYHATQREILRIDNDLREHFAVEPRGGHMVQPWVHQDKPLGPSANIILNYQIHIDTLPTSPLHLVLEQPERWDIRINDQAIDTDSGDSSWIDPAIKMLPLNNDSLRTGQNRLTLTGKFDRQTNLESLYLLGHFGVTLDGHSSSITNLPQSLTLGSWINQGLPFYSGNITYRTQFQCHRKPKSRYAIVFPGYNASLIEVKLNQNKSLLIGFGNDQIDITGHLNNGNNEIEITVYSSRRNTLGPLHLAEDNPNIIGSFTFQYDESKWQKNYKLIPYGLIKAPCILESI
jgi:hypothetical protein